MTKIQKPVSYTERVLPSISFLVAGLFLPAALFLVSLPFSLELAFVIALGSYLSLLGSSYLLAPKILLTEHTLQVSRAAISVDHLGSTSVINRQDQFSERGQKLSTMAYTRFQIGVKGLVKIEIADESDPTPYWLVATRHPEVLAGYLNAKR
jgi:hypothetical protein